MKTSDSIEQQEERKNARSNAESAQTSRENTPPVRPKLKQRDASRIASWRWQPGHCPNPGGRPKHDLSAEIARACFEQNAEALFKAYTKALLRGNAYAFKELSDRAYGKMTERVEYSNSEYRGQTEDDLQKRITELERDLGLVAQIDEAKENAPE
jgi:hypothetical protein